MESSLKKDIFRINQGLNTELNEINSADGFTTDERNYELKLDGSRRRRKGLAQESGGSALNPGITLTTTQIQQGYRWRSVGGDPTVNFIVHQVGSRLYFAPDDELISTGFLTSFIDLESSKATNATAANVQDTPCQFTTGRGHLFVSSRYIDPVYIEYDGVDSFATTSIDILYRDFNGIDDGVAIDEEPVTLTADHKYNLFTRGWRTTDLEQYNTDKTKHPAKKMAWYTGYRRLVNATYADEDGVQTWDSDKIEAQITGGADFRQGSVLLNPFDTQFAVILSAEGGANLPITTWSETGSGTWTVTVTVTSHGFSNTDTVTIQGNLALYFDSASEKNSFNFSLNGSHVISNVAANTFDISVTEPSNWFSWDDQFRNLGSISPSLSIAKSDGQEYDERPAAIEFHDGRLFYAGTPNSEYADRIFFSQLASLPNAYGKCYQQADPTAPEINALVATDGGEFTIGGLGQVKQMLSTRQGLLIYTSEGVWEVGGGQRGIFTADGYSIRKITNDECSSTMSPILIGSTAFHTGPKGIFQVAPNQFTGVLESTNITEQTIQTLWNEITTASQEVVQTTYDDSLRRLYFLYGNSPTNINQYNEVLVLDLKVGGWFKYVFDDSATSGLLGAYAISESDSTVDNKKIKWITQATNNVEIADLDQSDYVDFGGAESPLPYLVLGWDNIGDYQRRRQAPIITVYSKRTETGYTQTGNGWDGDNESSTLMRAYWDWTDDAVSGKIGSSNQVYRHTRAFVPSGASDVDGYPVVVTRNKVRGRGRVLQLRFDGEATKDSHLLGFSTNYKVTRKV